MLWWRTWRYSSVTCRKGRLVVIVSCHMLWWKTESHPAVTCWGGELRITVTSHCDGQSKSPVTCYAVTSHLLWQRTQNKSPVTCCGGLRSQLLVTCGGLAATITSYLIWWTGTVTSYLLLRTRSHSHQSLAVVEESVSLPYTRAMFSSSEVTLYLHNKAHV